MLRPLHWFEVPKTPLNPKNTKTNHETKGEIPHPGSGPKTTKKDRKIRKWPKNDTFRVFFGIFFVFLGPETFFVFRNLLYFRDVRGHWALYQASGIVSRETFANWNACKQSAWSTLLTKIPE